MRQGRNRPSATDRVTCRGIDDGPGRSLRPEARTRFRIVWRLLACERGLRGLTVAGLTTDGQSFAPGNKLSGRRLTS